MKSNQKYPGQLLPWQWFFGLVIATLLGAILISYGSRETVLVKVTGPIEYIGDSKSSVVATGHVFNEAGNKFKWKVFVLPTSEALGYELPCVWVSNTGMHCDKSLIQRRQRR